MPDDLTLTITRIYPWEEIVRGELSRSMVATFYVGNNGAYSARVPFTDNWHMELQAAVEREAAKVRQVLHR